MFEKILKLFTRELEEKDTLGREVFPIPPCCEEERKIYSDPYFKAGAKVHQVLQRGVGPIFSDGYISYISDEKVEFRSIDEEGCPIVLHLKRELFEWDDYQIMYLIPRPREAQWKHT